MALRPHTSFAAKTVRYAQATRRASVSRRGFLYGVFAMVLIVSAGAGTVWLNFRLKDLRLQQAHLQAHALELEQDRLRLVHAVERLADPARLQAIARTDLGLVELSVPTPSSTVIVRGEATASSAQPPIRRDDPVFDHSEPSLLVTAAVQLLGASEAVAAPLRQVRP